MFFFRGNNRSVRFHYSGIVFDAFIKQKENPDSSEPGQFLFAFQ